MGNASSIKIAALAFVAVVNAQDGPNRTMETCKAPIGRAIKVCKPWISRTCPQAAQMHHMAECYLRNRSQAPKQCQRAAQGAWACAAKQDATEECTDEFGSRAGPCMQCEVASKQAELECTETWFQVCSHVDVEHVDQAAAKECFMKNRKSFPKRCQRAARRVEKACKAEERMQQHQDRAMEAQQQQREHAMERMHREQEQQMEEMMQTTRQNHRQTEHTEMEHDRQMETAHEHMHPGMTHENHAEMETDMQKEHTHHEANMAMEAEMQTGVHQMEDMDRQAELLTTSAMDTTMNMHMHQEDMMQQEHSTMEAAPVDSRPISQMTMPVPTSGNGNDWDNMPGHATETTGHAYPSGPNTGMPSGTEPYEGHNTHHATAPVATSIPVSTPTQWHMPNTEHTEHGTEWQQHPTPATSAPSMPSTGNEHNTEHATEWQHPTPATSAPSMPNTEHNTHATEWQHPTPTEHNTEHATEWQHNTEHNTEWQQHPAPSMPSTGTDMPTTWTHGDGMPNYEPNTAPATASAPSTSSTWTHGDGMPNMNTPTATETHQTWHSGDNMPNGPAPSMSSTSMNMPTETHQSQHGMPSGPSTGMSHGPNMILNF